jgi:hypothetical protein
MLRCTIRMIPQQCSSTVAPLQYAGCATVAHEPVMSASWPMAQCGHHAAPPMVRRQMPEATLEATHRALRLDRLGCCSASGGSPAARWRVCQRQGRPTPPRIIGLAAPRPCAVTSPKFLKITETPPSPSSKGFEWGFEIGFEGGFEPPLYE